MADENSETTSKKSGGNRRKGASETPRPTMAFRVNAELYEKIQNSAYRRKVTITEEIESRLVSSFRSAADPYIGAAFTMAEANCDVIQQLLGKNIAEDPYTRAACAKAAAAAIELVGGLANQDTPETRALLQTDAEAFGQLVAMCVQAARDGIRNEFTEGLGLVAETVASRRRIEQDAEPSPQMLARALRESMPADSAIRTATPDEIANMVDAPGQLPESIGGQAIFDDAVAGLPLVRAERAAEKSVPETAPARRKARVKTEIEA